LRLDRNTALLVVDMQTGFGDPAWGDRNNPGMEANVAALIAAWREAAAPLFHVHHESPSPAGLLRRGTPGNAPIAMAQPLAGEHVYRKTVNSAFVGTTLRADLRRLGIDTLVVVGLTTNHCISTTARMAGNLGFETFVVADATAAFARAALDGRIRPAEEVHMDALSDLRGEFAEIVTTAETLAALAASARPQASLRRAGVRSPGLY
jgi:nicotinamidase-related amidase